MSITHTSQDNNTASFVATLIGGLIATFGGLSATEMAAVAGAVLAAAGFIVNTIALYRRDRREQKLADIMYKKAKRNLEDRHDESP